jgi:nuclease-like protein
MKVLRTGGRFADRQIRHRGKKVLYYFAGFLTVCAIFFFVSYEIVALLGLVLAFWHFTKAYDKWEHWFLGKRGELAVTRALSGLPDDYVLLNDLLLPKRGGNIDHFLIGPNGLFVIETKNYATNMKCNGDQWFRNGKPVKSLSSQVKGNAIALRKNLQPLFAQHRAYLPYVEPVLVFVKHRHRLEIHDPTVHVLKAEDLVKFIWDYER